MTNERVFADAKTDYYDIIINMKTGTKNYIRGVGMMVGTIIGVGIFGVPYVLAQSGIIVGLFYFALLGTILTLNHLLFGEMLLRVKGKHHLAGLAGHFGNRSWEYFALLVTTFSFYGALIAYIILGGKFLEIVLTPFFGQGLFIYQMIFFSFMSFFVLVGVRLVAFSELFMSFLLLAVMAVIVGFGIPKINIANFFTFNLNQAFLPYGVILFSLAGAAAIPEMVEIMPREKKKLKSAIIVGTLIPLFLTLIFSLVVVGITGANTVQDAVEGLRASVGDWIVYLGAIFGLFAVATSFLAMALYLREQFWYDLKINKYISWLLACVIPLLIFLFGTRNFIQVVGFTGAVFSGLEGILIIWIYRLARKKGTREPEYKMRLPFAVLAIMMLVFILGIVYEVLSTI
ncbi:hypothetical protein L6259_03910 [Candidatus Parcubacteria bacterium]|nr:hypothetical protein [Patescibacteria group bacterium]MCG2694382.1 hypothetical protein [Candidatus Parcubacteria bacterium]